MTAVLKPTPSAASVKKLLIEVGPKSWEKNKHNIRITKIKDTTNFRANLNKGIIGKGRILKKMVGKTILVEHGTTYEVKSYTLDGIIAIITTEQVRLVKNVKANVVDFNTKQPIKQVMEKKKPTKKEPTIKQAVDKYQKLKITTDGLDVIFTVGKTRILPKRGKETIFVKVKGEEEGVVCRWVKTDWKDSLLNESKLGKHDTLQFYRDFLGVREWVDANLFKGLSLNLDDFKIYVPPKTKAKK